MHRLVLPLFGGALFLSAALLFNVQPMVGKLLLPRVGGSPEVWNVALAFFQATLLLGYLFAHRLSRLRPHHHGAVYLVVLALAGVVLPIALPAGWRPTGPPQLAVVAVLTTAVALPFLALSLGAPTLQRLFSASAHGEARDPYFLYAASNAGSFVGLLLYPLVLEPWLAISEQTAVWACAYALFFAVAAVAVASTWRTARIAAPEAVHVGPPASVSWEDRLTWLALAAVPSSLTLGVTTHIATDVAATPLLWAVTLGLYLSTFIVAFARRGASARRWTLTLHPWLGAVGIATATVPVLGTWLGVVFQLAAFTATALALHSRLADRRPTADQLTSFYLWVSVGGAIGGSFNAFVAPVIFDRQLEYPLVLVLGLALNPLVDRRTGQAGALVAMIGAAAAFALVAAGLGVGALGWGLAGVVLAILLLVAPRPSFAILAGPAVVGVMFSLLHSTDRFVDRNFFGIVAVRDTTAEDGRVVRQILHGTTVHGAQIVEPEVVAKPIGYYSEYSPIAAVFRVYAPERVGIVGLASGGMNCFARPGQAFRFYEIDPLMLVVARQSFTFLADCGAPVVQIGDGRLLIESEAPGSFDLIGLDAFASDAIPVHLITTEAIALYFDRLAPDGVLTFNITNRYFDMVPVLSANANALGLVIAVSATIPPPEEREIAFTSQWATMARSEERLEPLLREPGWHLVADPGARPWTDGYSNPLSALKSASGYAGAVQLTARP